MKLKTILLVSSAVTFFFSTSAHAQTNASPATLRAMAGGYYDWRNQQYPVFSSDAGLHTWDHKLTDYSPAALAMRRAHVVRLLSQLNSMRTSKWSKDDQIDWLLFRAQLEYPVFFDRVMDFEHRDPQVYVNEC